MCIGVRVCVCLDGGMKIVDLIKGNKLKNWKNRDPLLAWFLLVPVTSFCTLHIGMSDWKPGNWHRFVAAISQWNGKKKPNKIMGRYFGLMRAFHRLCCSRAHYQVTDGSNWIALHNNLLYQHRTCIIWRGGAESTAASARSRPWCRDNSHRPNGGKLG